MDTRRKGAKWRNPHGGEGTSKEGRRVLSYPWYFRDHDNPTDSNKVAEGIRRLEREREQEGRKEGRSVVTGWEKKNGRGERSTRWRRDRQNVDQMKMDDFEEFSFLEDKRIKRNFFEGSFHGTCNSFATNKRHKDQASKIGQNERAENSLFL